MVILNVGQDRTTPVVLPPNGFVSIGFDEGGAYDVGFTYEDKVMKCFTEFSYENRITKTPIVINTKISSEERILVTDNEENVSPMEIDILYLNTFTRTLNVFEIKSCNAIVKQPGKRTSLNALSFALFKAAQQVDKDKDLLNGFIPEFKNKELKRKFKYRAGIIIPKFDNRGNTLKSRIASFTSSAVFYDGNRYKWTDETRKNLIEKTHKLFKNCKLKVPKPVMNSEESTTFRFHHIRDISAFIKVNCDHNSSVDMIKNDIDVTVIPFNIYDEIIYFDENDSTSMRALIDNHKCTLNNTAFDYIYTKIVAGLAAESIHQTVKDIENLSRNVVDYKLNTLISDSKDEPKLLWTKEQKTYYEKVLQTKYAIITGGYGSGKTEALKLKLIKEMKTSSADTKVVFAIVSSCQKDLKNRIYSSREPSNAIRRNLFVNLSKPFGGSKIHRNRVAELRSVIGSTEYNKNTFERDLLAAIIRDQAREIKIDQDKINGETEWQC